MVYAYTLVVPVVECKQYYSMDEQRFETYLPYPSLPSFSQQYYPFYPTQNNSFGPSFDLLRQKYEELQEEHEKLLEKYSQLEKKSNSKKRIKRRVEAQLIKCYQCPYQTCKKAYASDFALNLHIRNKHNGGSKKERDEAAKIILKYEEEGKKPPKQKIRLPPGYLQSNKVRLMLMNESEEERGVKMES